MKEEVPRLLRLPLSADATAEPAAQNVASAFSLVQYRLVSLPLLTMVEQGEAVEVSRIYMQPGTIMFLGIGISTEHQKSVICVAYRLPWQLAYYLVKEMFHSVSPRTEHCERHRCSVFFIPLY